MLKKKNGTVCGILVWSGLIILSGVFILFYLAKYGNSTQIYNDFIVGYLSRYGANKEVEKRLLYFLLGNCETH